MSDCCTHRLHSRREGELEKDENITEETRENEKQRVVLIMDTFV